MSRTKALDRVHECLQHPLDDNFQQHGVEHIKSLLPPEYHIALEKEGPPRKCLGLLGGMSTGTGTDTGTGTGTGTA